MQSHLKQFIPHLIVLLLFIAASLVYFHPVLKGEAIFQSDIVQYIGMAKQQKDFKAATGEETYWTNSAFGGMPTYQLGAKYPHNYIKKLDAVLRFLPRPADYLFLYFIGIYILFITLKVNYKLAFLGALAFGFSTYLIIILGVGHNAKAHAIAYMPLVISGIILTFRKKYLFGFILTTIAMALELVANHFQMTYYLLLLVICLGIAHLIDAFKKQKMPDYFKSIGILVLAVALALGLNATSILATKEYADTSTRGKNELTITPEGTPKLNKEGLDYEYITEYSYGKTESFNLLIPRFMGGGSSDEFPKNSQAVGEIMKLGASEQEATQFLNEQIPFYWGDQPIVAAPAYIGAIVIFLAVLSLFLIKGRLKWWLVSGFMISLLLSWGRNLPGLTRFFIENIPLYNKFRAVSSIQVIIELVTPILAVIGLQHYFYSSHSIDKKRDSLIYSLSIVGGIVLIFILGKSALLKFASPYDPQIIEQMGVQFMDAVRADRKTVLTNDALRSLLFICLTAGTLWAVLKRKIKPIYAITAISILVIMDLVGIDRRYVNKESFVSARIMENPFPLTEVDKNILKDNGYYRVYDVTSSPFNSGQTSFYHNSVGGYHAAKPKRMQDLHDFYLAKNGTEILNMLNVKYIKIPTKEGKIAQENPNANGPAWFVKNVLPANNTNEEITLLDSLDTKQTAVIYKGFLDKVPTKNVSRDSTASIELIKHLPNYLSYKSKSNTSQLAVFSEIYYPKGWNAYINGSLATHFRANYTLRAMTIPKGNHNIEFKFEPKVIKKGSSITLGSSIVFALILAGGLFLKFRKKEKEGIL